MNDTIKKVKKTHIIRESISKLYILYGTCSYNIKELLQFSNKK